MAMTTQFHYCSCGLERAACGSCGNGWAQRAERQVAHHDSHRRASLGGGIVGNVMALAPRSSSHMSSESGSLGAPSRRSPHLGDSRQSTISNQIASAPWSGRALNDITNTNVNLNGKTAKPLPSRQTSVPPTERHGHPQALKMPVVVLHPHTVRGPGEAHSHVPALLATFREGSSLEDSNLFQGDANNSQNVHEYVDDIWDLLFQEEEKSQHLRQNYMDFQTDVNTKMRAILIDWLVEVHLKYRLCKETLFLTVDLIDRYLSCALVSRRKLQLVGVAAMFIASKYEDIHPPAVHDFVHITDNAYTKEELIAMECKMLTALNFKIVVPTIPHFLERLQKANHCDDKHKQLSEYIIELGLLDMQICLYPPSQVASSALRLSNELLNKRQLWPQLMVQQSRHADGQLSGSVQELRELLEAAPTAQLQAVRKKFLTPLRHSVAEIAL